MNALTERRGGSLPAEASSVPARESLAMSIRQRLPKGAAKVARSRSLHSLPYDAL
jgi:hypothetical protein